MSGDVGFQTLDTLVAMETGTARYEKNLIKPSSFLNLARVGCSQSNGKQSLI